MITAVNYNQQKINFQARFRMNKSKSLVKQPLVKTLLTGWSSGVSTMSFFNHSGFLFHSIA